MTTENKTTDKEKTEKEKTYGLTYVQNFLKDIIDLRKGVDKKGVIEEIKAKKSMSGANAWMLMCSIIIASIGLDRNSDAVIIGAMLISPLMSPILGIGLGIGINDKEVIKRSFIHFTAAILIAIIASTLYFLLTPFGDITPAIASRTEPNTLDVLVAIFGGLAGIISIARKDISTTLPGVAIATALMPPLCVAGFGIAKADWNFALNAFYLFILNTSFISISTYVIIRFLRFPYRRYLNQKERRRNRLVVFLFGLLIIIPSFYVLSQLLQRNNTQNIIKEFVEKDFGEDRIYLDGFTKLETDTSSTLVLKVYGNKIRPENEADYEAKLAERGLENWKVKVLKASDVNLDDYKTLEQKILEVREYAEHEKEAEAQRISLIETKVQDSIMNRKLNEEILVLFDEVETVSFGEMNSKQDSIFTKVHTVLVELKDKAKLSKAEEQKMLDFLQTRIKEKPLKIYID